jgi:hypothetical protein
MHHLLDADGDEAGLGKPATGRKGECPGHAVHAIVDASLLLGSKEVARVDGSMVGVGLEVCP